MKDVRQIMTVVCSELFLMTGKIIVDAVLAGSPPKRKAARPPKEIYNAHDEPESGHRAKRTRSSIGGPTTLVKSKPEERAKEKSSKKFDGVVLPSRRRSARHEPEPEKNDEVTSGEVFDGDDEEALGSTDGI